MHGKNQSSDSRSIEGRITSDAEVTKGCGLMQRALTCFFIVLVCTTSSLAADPPNAPSTVISASPAIEIVTPPMSSKGAIFSAESKVVDKKFLALAVVSTGATFSDSYTTLFARQNWLAGKKGVCNAEVQSAYLYGTHPSVGRAYAVASAKSIGSVAASYYLRKHHSRFWSLPLVANSILSLQGTTQNMIACN